MSSKNIDPSIKLFADVARQYCTWVEGEFRQPQGEMQHARQLLAELYLAVIGLPDLEGMEEDDENPVGISKNEWSNISRKFGHLPIDSYWDVFNPLEDTEPILNSLADDLSDIYRDVKRGLVLFESNGFLNAAWEWQFSFQIHWGRHLLGAQRAIHEYLSDKNL